METPIIKNIIVNKEMGLPRGKHINNLNVLVLRKEIQKQIWNENPHASEVYGVDGEGDYFIFVYMPANPREHSYTRLTIQW